MQVLHKTGREVKVGDWITIKDFKGRTHRFEVMEFEPLMVRVREHKGDSRYWLSLPYHSLHLRTPYVDNLSTTS